MLYAHAFLGCDTTSRIFGFGKGLVLKLVQDESNFLQQATVFMNATSSKEDVVKARENHLC